MSDKIDTVCICISAPKSGSGKTMFTLGLIKLLRDRGLGVKCYKAGPDHIDPLFHDRINDDKEHPTENLDTFYSDREEINRIFAQGLDGADIAVVEGVMGLYDGIIPWDPKHKEVPCSDLLPHRIKASTYELASFLSSPVILIVDAKGSSASLVAQIKGFVDYDCNRLICGVVLNRCSKAVHDRLSGMISSALGIKVYGYIPECEDIRIESRYLGLVLPEEVVDIRQKTGVLASLMSECVDIDGIIKDCSSL